MIDPALAFQIAVRSTLIASPEVDQIEAALIVKMREREADRAAKAQEEDDEAVMLSNPNYGIF